jgi:hypothetical protein
MAVANWARNPPPIPALVGGKEQTARECLNIRHRSRLSRGNDVLCKIQTWKKVRQASIGRVVPQYANTMATSALVCSEARAMGW